jgi:hypothetical protein
LSRRLLVEDYYTKKNAVGPSFMVSKDFYKEHEEVFFELIFPTTDLSEYHLKKTPMINTMRELFGSKPSI